jgi:hypothetical protein
MMKIKCFINLLNKMIHLLNYHSYQIDLRKFLNFDLFINTINFIFIIIIDLKSIKKIWILYY